MSFREESGEGKENSKNKKRRKKKVDEFLTDSDERRLSYMSSDFRVTPIQLVSEKSCVLILDFFLKKIDEAELMSLWNCDREGAGTT
jgi:hypothetical protein